VKTHPIDGAAVATLGLARLARAVLVPVVALALTVAGWQPAQTAPAPLPRYVPDACVPIPGPASLTVAQLRTMARAAGLRSLARSGRRADLLAALGLA
jgi:hypothetical protein